MKRLFKVVKETEDEEIKDRDSQRECCIKTLMEIDFRQND